jgi:uncharacterized protein YjbI with pentapeptide repeats
MLVRANFIESNLTSAQLLSSNLARANLTRANLSSADLSSATLMSTNFTGADASNASFERADLTFAVLAFARTHGASFRGADTRGARDLNLINADTGNMIFPDGSLPDGLSLAVAEVFTIRNFPASLDPGQPAISIMIHQQMDVAEDSIVRFELHPDDWRAPITFAEGIPVTLAGTLELTFTNDVDVATQIGRKLHIFDWTGVEPTGAFTVASPYLWDLTNLYSTGEVRLTGTGGVADYDRSGTVEQTDLDFVLLNWGADATTPPAGWVNDIPRGLIDQEELDKVLLNWGSTSTPVGTASIPEPATWLTMLITLALLTFAAGRKESRKPAKTPYPFARRLRPAKSLQPIYSER